MSIIFPEGEGEYPNYLTVSMDSDIDLGDQSYALGLYERILNLRHNGKPVWKYVVGSQYLFFSGVYEGKYKLI